jgi:tRNA(fMet)-specific endonuclease VapC
VSFLLDTNICIALITGRSPAARARFAEIVAAGREVAVSSIVIFELAYGVARSTRRAENAETLAAFLAGPLAILDFDSEDATAAGALRAELRAAGTPIGAYDVLIAGQALRRRLTVATANVAEFARVQGLSWEDWSIA